MSTGRCCNVWCLSRPRQPASRYFQMNNDKYRYIKCMGLEKIQKRNVFYFPDFRLSRKIYCCRKATSIFPSSDFSEKKSFFFLKIGFGFHFDDDNEPPAHFASSGRCVKNTHNQQFNLENRKNCWEQRTEQNTEGGKREASHPGIGSSSSTNIDRVKITLITT